MVNPYSLNFGFEPENYIERAIEVDQVIENFENEKSGSRLYMITGIRGCGKTVTMTEIEKHFRDKKDWIVIDLNPELDLLNELAAELSNRPSAMQIFKDAKINLSAFGFGLEIDGVPPITSINVALDRMLEKLTKSGKKVLIAVDEVTNSENIKSFVSQFQIYMRKKYGVYMLMTGLYKNVYDLQNEESLTFLYRAPKIRLNALNVDRIALEYKQRFKLSADKATEMANFTEGYAYAYQVLGYLCFKHNTTYDEVVQEFDLYMGEYSYDKIWSELSKEDKKTIVAMCQAKSMKAADIKAFSGQSDNYYNRYRTRLLEKEVIKKADYGYVKFTLPRFKEYALNKATKEGL